MTRSEEDGGSGRTRKKTDTKNGSSLFETSEEPSKNYRKRACVAATLTVRSLLQIVSFCALLRQDSITEITVPRDYSAGRTLRDHSGPEAISCLSAKVSMFNASERFIKLFT